MRAIDGDWLHMGIAMYLAENAHMNDTPQSALEMVAKWIEKAPTVDVKPVVNGRIIQTIKNGKYNRVFSCCGTDFTNLTMWMIPNFCPHCGAKIDEKEKTGD